MFDRARVSEPGTVSDPVQLRKVLAAQVSRVLTKQNGREDRQRVARIAVPVEMLDPFQWLRAQHDVVKLYWRSREDATAIAAVGTADCCSGDALSWGEGHALKQGLLPLLSAGGRYYGGLRFDLDRTPDASWTPFGAYRFVLPRFELWQRGERSRLVCNVVLPRDRARRHEILAEINELAFPAHPLGGALTLPLSREDLPTDAGWRENVQWVLEAFARGTLGKVVLARKVVFRFPESVDALLLMKKLQAATPHCFHFYFQPTHGVAFVGASPERLFLREGRRLFSEAVAGTRPRGASAVADERLREELLQSQKDRLEHVYVQQHVQHVVGTLSEKIEVDGEASEMKLARGRHLYARVTGLLKDGIGSLDVLRRLHPTPAVGGQPTAAALQAIASLEPFDRGWYAGPIGWISAQAAEFAVGIRSALVQAGRLSLFSGAGIVSGSTPQQEWEEIEHKIGDFINVLGLDLRSAKY